MDDIIDLEIEKIDTILEKINNDPEDDEIKRVERKLWEKIRRKTLMGRRTGVGITAEGDMLAALNLCYGTPEATDFAVSVQKTLAIEAYRSSVKLARERGAFEMYDAQREKNNPFILRIKAEDPALYDEMTRYGRRNIALLTIAPTGTTSLMTQTTSGIEPVFRPVYTRRRKVNPNDNNVIIAFTDATGDAFEEFNVFHHKFMVWLETNGYDPEQVAHYDKTQIDELIEKSPYYRATSNDIDWVAKVEMQGRIQQWVDHSISVTINLPENTPEDLVWELYIKAWECGCKGITVYREGSRDGVLISKSKEENKSAGSATVSKPLVRPDALEAEIIRFKNNNEEWIAFIGLFNGRPYEIFTGKTEDEVLPVPRSIDRGMIIKVKDNDGKRYDFQYTDRYGYKNTMGGLSRTFNKEYWNYAKLISSVLRYGMPIPDVVNLVTSLNLSDEAINTWKNGVVRALRKYVPDGTKAAKEICPQCGCEGTLIYSEGCLKCTSCGQSKCG